MKDTKKTKYIFFTIPFYMIATFSIAVYLFAEIHPRVLLAPEARLVLLGLFCVCAYIGSRMLCKRFTGSESQIMKIAFAIFFLLYLLLLLTLTLFDPMFGRENGVRSFNFIPFATILNYGKAMFTQSMNASAIVTNLLGNLVAFMPFALFLPMFFRKCEKYSVFLLTTAGSVMAIELLQLVLAVGSCDIDDLILNVFGAWVAFLILKIKPINKLVNKLAFLW